MKKYALIMIGTLLSSPVFAAGYGEAGCGVGSLIFGNSKGPTQILAASTNSTFYQSFAISSGTSNCDAKGFDTASLERQQFVENNLASLAKDAANGQGEQLAALAGLFGCSAAEQSRFNTLARQNYGAIFADKATPADVVTSFKGVVANDAELSNSCIN